MHRKRRRTGTGDDIVHIVITGKQRGSDGSPAQKDDAVMATGMAIMGAVALYSDAAFAQERAMLLPGR